MQPDDISLKEQYDTGLSAERVLMEPAYEAAVRMTEDRLEQEWMTTQPEETAKREMCWAKMQALEELHRSVVILHERGGEAKRKLDDANKGAE